MISSGEAGLAHEEEDREVAVSTEAWLMSLSENLEEVKTYTQEAFDKRRELIRLLVEEIAVGRTEEARPKVDITYRFGPPAAESTEACVSGEQNSMLF